MHPKRELIQLAAHKAVLRRSITHHRLGFAAAVDPILQPLQWFDRARASLRRLAPFAPLALIVFGFFQRRRSVGPSRSRGRLFHWGRVLRFTARGLGILIATRKAAHANQGSN